jgi:hypothetical protein
MRKLIEENLANIPLPGGGNTLERWRALAAVAAIDLSLAKIYEGHTDAIAILAELDGGAAEGLWGVWAAETPGASVVLRNGRVSGRKLWCSGAKTVDNAVMSVRTASGHPALVRISLHQDGITVCAGDWHAVGMAASESGVVNFDSARVKVIGKSGDYLGRAGFWHGGAGIAAVWFGAAVAVGRLLTKSLHKTDDAHAAAHLGAVDTALSGARALLLETADWIDARPAADAAGRALRVRACVEDAAQQVLVRTARALGPAPLCNNAIHAQRCADLGVYLRQSHAERDLATLGGLVAYPATHWSL